MAGLDLRVCSAQVHYWQCFLYGVWLRRMVGWSISQSVGFVVDFVAEGGCGGKSNMCGGWRASRVVSCAVGFENQKLAPFGLFSSAVVHSSERWPCDLDLPSISVYDAMRFRVAAR